MQLDEISTSAIIPHVLIWFSNVTPCDGKCRDACFKFYGNKAYEKELHLLTFQIIIMLLEFSPPFKEDLYSLVRVC
jgi:hypothetical protein